MALLQHVAASMALLHQWHCCINGVAAWMTLLLLMVYSLHCGIYGVVGVDVGMARGTQAACLHRNGRRRQRRG